MGNKYEYKYKCKSWGARGRESYDEVIKRGGDYHVFDICSGTMGEELKRR